MGRSILRTRTFAHPPERVWRALTTPEILAVWLMPNDFRPDVGHQFQFRTDPSPGFDGIVESEVLELVAPRSLVLAWRGNGLNTQVSFELHESAGGTTLVLCHSGFEGGRGLATSLILGAGWSRLIRRRLRSVLDDLGADRDLTLRHHPKDARGAWAWMAWLFRPFLRRPGGDR